MRTANSNTLNHTAVNSIKGPAITAKNAGIYTNSYERIEILKCASIIIMEICAHMGNYAIIPVIKTWSKTTMVQAKQTKSTGII